MTNELFLVSAYLVIWGGVFAYLFYTNSQQRMLARRLQILEETFTEHQ